MNELHFFKLMLQKVRIFPPKLLLASKVQLESSINTQNKVLK